MASYIRRLHPVNLLQELMSIETKNEWKVYIPLLFFIGTMVVGYILGGEKTGTLVFIMGCFGAGVEVLVTAIIDWKEKKYRSLMLYGHCTVWYIALYGLSPLYMQFILPWFEAHLGVGHYVIYSPVLTCFERFGNGTVEAVVGTHPSFESFSQRVRDGKRMWGHYARLDFTWVGIGWPLVGAALEYVFEHFHV